MASALPATHRALVLKSTQAPLDMTVESTSPVPQPSSGNAVIKVLAAPVISYSREVFSGVRRYNYPEPMVPGSGGIGRIVAVGSDATSIQPGQLVLTDAFIRGRDDESKLMIGGLEMGSGKDLMYGEWRDGTFAEYHKAPLENIHFLDEKKLMGKKEEGGLGLSIEDLCYLFTLCVPYGGWRDVNLQVGETVLIAPATGSFGSAAVRMALIMGAGKVLIMGRDPKKLKALEDVLGNDPRLHSVPITGDVDADTQAIKQHGLIDVFFDLTPATAGNSTHFKSAFYSLAQGGRVCFMSGQIQSLDIPLTMIVHKNIRMHGVWMYTRDNVKDLIKLANLGVLKLGDTGRKVTAFKLEQFSEAFDFASDNAGPQDGVVFLL